MSPPYGLPRPLIGCIADDFTGATDLANMLVKNGMRTVQTVGVPASSARIEADALVVALKSRTIASASAAMQAKNALAWLRVQGCRQFLFKYGATFDSTQAGNIGPVMEALLDALAIGDDRGFTIACPASPENGQTLYRGHLFIDDTLLNESGMENHPLTPMTDSNLVRVLQQQTSAKVGLIRFDTIAQGVAAVREQITTLRAQAVRIAVADALSDQDLRVLGEACGDLPLITGGSGIAMGLPGNFQRSGLLAKHGDAARLPAIDGLGAVLAGSVTKATAAQIIAWRGSDKPHFRLDPQALARGEPVVEAALAYAREYLLGSQAQPVLFYASPSPDIARPERQPPGVPPTGELIEAALASIARGLHSLGVRKFVVAGGETSGAVMQALQVQALAIGAPIDPGVPAAITLGEKPLGFALKSGNFGSVDFFDKALRRLSGTP
jgi:uncharacterized protein YgbK (DUF1537 family)